MLGHEDWLKIAQDDLSVAKILLPQGLFSPLTYHCQQAAEKTLKGYFVFKNQPLIKTHDLYKLLEVCLIFDKDFEKIFQAIRVLNPYATKFRYPTEYDIPDVSDAEIAIKSAQIIMKFVLKKIAEPDTKQKDIFNV